MSTRYSLRFTRSRYEIQVMVGSGSADAARQSLILWIRESVGKFYEESAVRPTMAILRDANFNRDLELEVTDGDLPTGGKAGIVIDGIPVVVTSDGVPLPKYRNTIPRRAQEILDDTPYLIRVWLTYLIRARRRGLLTR